MRTREFFPLLESDGPVRARRRLMLLETLATRLTAFRAT